MKNSKFNLTAKVLGAGLMTSVVTLAAATSAFALTPVEGHDNCYYNYQCNKSVYDVTIDGVYDEKEWSDATELVINEDTLDLYGRFQTKGTASPEDLSCTYRFKWDEDYLYMIEIRTDSHYVSAFGDKDHGGGACYSMDGTAIRFCDTADLIVENIFNIEYNSFVEEENAPTVQLYGHGVEDDQKFQGPSGTDNITYAGKLNGNVVTFEMKLPWEFMRDQETLDSDIKEGTTFRFTPIIMSRDSIEDYSTWNGLTDSFRQINFHDCVRIPESGQTGLKDPAYFALFSLAGAAVKEPTTTDEPTTTPDTFDAAIAALAIACASCATVVALKKKAK